MKNLGRLLISKDILEDILPLPKSTRVLGSKLSESKDFDIEFYIEAEGIPPRM